MSSSVPQYLGVESLFRRHGFHLLISPTSSLQIGDIYEGRENSIDISLVDNLESFLKPKKIIPTPVFRYPAITKGFKTYDYKGLIKRISNKSIAIEFFKNLFNRVAKGFGVDLSAKYSSEKIQTTAYSFVSNTVDSIRLNHLTRSLENFMPDYELWKNDRSYYVVTEIYRSKEIGLIFLDGSQSEIEIALDAAEMAKLRVTHKKVDEGMEIIFHKDEEPLPFGIKLGKLGYDYTSERIQVNPTDEVYQPKGIGVKSSSTGKVKRKRTSRRTQRLSVKNTRLKSPDNFVVRIKS